MMPDETGERPRTILSLDGGGVRGIITLAFLDRIETILNAQTPSTRPLADHFDLIGGTSTGAIIGGALALGQSPASLVDFYRDFAPRIFRRRAFRLYGIQPVFDATALKQEIEKIAGDRTLDTPDLRTYLAIIMKRLDTGSAWIVSNNPKAPYWDDPDDEHYIGNRHYRLADLVRASAAAPHYFAPQEISVHSDMPPGLFIDGAVTPYNNPALALFQMVTVPNYGFCWPTGVAKLRIVSIGTGKIRDRMDAGRAKQMTAAGLAIRALSGLIGDCDNQTLFAMQALGKTLTPWIINSEVGALEGYCIAPEPLFTFIRYNVELERDWLADNLGITVSPSHIERLRHIDDAQMIPLAHEIGIAAAEKMVSPDHW